MARKTTGIVRRIDDLGRVVLPREIQRNLDWEEFTPLEISVDMENDEVILSRFSGGDIASARIKHLGTMFKDMMLEKDITEEEYEQLTQHLAVMSETLDSINNRDDQS